MKHKMLLDISNIKVTRVYLNKDTNLIYVVDNSGPLCNPPMYPESEDFHLNTFRPNWDDNPVCEQCHHKFCNNHEWAAFCDDGYYCPKHFLRDVTDKNVYTELWLMQNNGQFDGTREFMRKRNIILLPNTKLSLLCKRLGQEDLYDKHFR